MPDDIIHSLQMADVLARFQRGKLFLQNVLKLTETDRYWNTRTNPKKAPPSGGALLRFILHYYKVFLLPHHNSLNFAFFEINSDHYGSTFRGLSTCIFTVLHGAVASNTLIEQQRCRKIGGAAGSPTVQYNYVKSVLINPFMRVLTSLEQEALRYCHFQIIHLMNCKTVKHHQNSIYLRFNKSLEWGL